MGIRALFFIIPVLALAHSSQAKENVDLNVLEAIENYKLPSSFRKNPTNKPICDVLQETKEVALKYKDKANAFIRLGLAQRRGKQFDESKNRKIADDFKKFKSEFLSDMKKIERERLLVPRIDIEDANILELFEQIIQNLLNLPKKLAWLLFGGNNGIGSTSSTSTWKPPNESTTARRPIESEPESGDVFPWNESDSSSEDHGSPFNI